MFYHYSTLTEKKYGVATVWLVATLGSKTTISKKLQKKDILEVNLPKACETIIHPEAPLALRLQSNLLYGVSRVFREQYQYFYSDVSNAHLRITRELLTMNVQNVTLDTNFANIKPANLMLQEDPAFIPGLALSSLAFDFDEGADVPDQAYDVLSTHTRSSRARSISLPDESPQRSRINIPSSSSRGINVQSPFDEGDYKGRTEDLFDPDPGFVFDENGELGEVLPQQNDDFENDPYDFDLADRGSPSRGYQPGKEQKRWESESAVSDQVRKDHAEAMQDIQIEPYDPNDDLDNLPQIDLMQLDEDPIPGGKHVEESEYSTQSSVPTSPEPKAQPRKRVLKIKHDEVIEIRRTAMSEQSTSYIEDMKKLCGKKHQQKNLLKAKSVAEEMIYGWSKDNKNSTIAKRFNGQRVLELLNNKHKGLSKKQSHKGKKRTSFADTDLLADKRARTASPMRDDNEIGLNLAPNDANDAYEPNFMEFDDEQYADPSLNIEIGRRASSQPDSTIMPWNISGRNSRAGSVFGAGGYATSSVVGLPSSALRGSGMQPLLHSHISTPIAGPSRLKDKLASNTKESIMENARTYPDSFDGEDDLDLLPENEQDMAILGEEYNDEAFAPDDQLLYEQNEQTETNEMELESGNFLEFLKHHLIEHQEKEDEIKDLTFEQLLDPKTCTSMMAAQGLHHVLLLATRNFISVSQPDHFGQISLALSNSL